MEAELLPFLILFLIIGIFSGLLAGLLGIGGGVIIIPAVFYALNFYDFSIEIIMRVAIASSLGVIMITSLSSMYSHYKLRNIDLDIIKKWFGGIIVGSISGVIFANSVDGNILVIIFVIIASIVAINMILNKNIVLANELPQSFILNNIISFLIGCFSALIGIGGGSFTVPTLSLFSKKMHKAVGTSAVFGFFIALPGAITYIILGWDVENLPPYSFGYVNLLIVLLVVSASVFTANFGAKLSTKIQTTTLKKIFAVFLLCICISLIIEHFVI